MGTTGKPDIAAWLAEIGMSQFSDVFISNGIDFDLLPELTSQDLSEVGVLRLVDRKTILKEIRLLTLEKARNSVQRRVLSVFFCDMVGSTARSTEIDPEEFRDEMKLYQDAVVASVNRHGGFVARFLGDGVLAYFGWPHADEDQASQAVRAALDTIHRVGELKGFPAQCRIGIATGRVVVGGQQDLDSAFGETPNLAARLQSLADTDQIVIESTTKRAIGNRFLVDYLQKTQLKGFEQPVSVWSVVKERKYIDRFESRGGSGSAFVGRNEELNMMSSAWAKTQAGRGQAILLRGDPGIGKSRLVNQFCETQIPEGTEILRYQCSSHHINSAFYPVIQQFEQVTEIDATRDTEAQKLEKMKERLHPSIAQDSQAVELVATLLSITDADTSTASELNALERRKLTIEILIQNAQLRAGGNPVVFVIEDTHWIDPSSKQLLEYIIENIELAPILILITSRHANNLNLADSSILKELLLPHLSEDSIEKLTRAIDPTSLLSTADVQNIVRRADGVPLFAEEIALAAMEFGSRGEAFELPESVEASLAARLDLLGDAKLAIQVASVIGREFKLPQLQALATTEDSTVLAAMGTAIASGLVQEVRTLSDRAFRFSHALVQDVAYNGLLKQQRRGLHRRLAIDVMDESNRQREPELVALHLTCAEEFSLAIDYWRLAANKSTAASANAEAISQFQQGLRLISKLPEGEIRDETEFGLLVGMGVPLIVEKGYTSDELERCISDALHIGKRVKYTPDIYSLLFNQWGYKLTVGMIEDARHIACEFSKLAEEQNDEVAKYARYRMLGATHMCLGELDSAKRELTILVDDYVPEQHAKLKSVYGIDLRIAGRCFLSEVLWLMGDIDEAQASATQALVEARKIQHLHSHAFSLHFCALIAFLARDRELVLQHTAELMELAREHAIGAWPTVGRSMQAWARLNDKNSGDMINAIEDGVSAAQNLGVAMFMPFFYCRIAEELLHLGQLEQAAQHLQKIEDLIARTAESIFKGEFLQLKAQLRLREGDNKGAVALFEEGLSHASTMGANSVVLRVANSYANFLLKQGEPKKAQEILLPAIGAFKQTLCTSDLRRGRELLGGIQAALDTP